jgi:hypothetical protein
MSSTAGQIINALGSIDEQRELFLLKFKTVERSECEELAEVKIKDSLKFLFLL